MKPAIKGEMIGSCELCRKPVYEYGDDGQHSAAWCNETGVGVLLHERCCSAVEIMGQREGADLLRNRQQDQLAPAFETLAVEPAEVLRAIIKVARHAEASDCALVYGGRLDMWAARAIAACTYDSDREQLARWVRDAAGVATPSAVAYLLQIAERVAGEL